MNDTIIMKPIYISENKYIDVLCQNEKKISLTDFLLKTTNLRKNTIMKYIYEICFNDKYLGEYIKNKNDKSYFIGLFGLYLFLNEFIKVYKNRNGYSVYNTLYVNIDKFMFLNKSADVMESYFAIKYDKYVDNILESLRFNFFVFDNSYNIISFFLETILKMNNQNILMYVCKKIHKNQTKTISYVQTIDLIYNILIDNIDEFPPKIKEVLLPYMNESYPFNIDILFLYKNILVTEYFTSLGTCSICYNTDTIVTSPQKSYYIYTKCRCIGEDKYMCMECLKHMNDVMNSIRCPFCKMQIGFWYKILFKI